MRSSVLIATLVIILAFFLSPLARSPAQNVLNVPSKYKTIQGAIDAAKNGDTVLVAPGWYSEIIDFKGKAITVRSAMGASFTTISGG